MVGLLSTTSLCPLASPAGVGASEGTCVFVEVSLIKAVNQSGFQTGFTTSLNCPVTEGVTTEVALVLAGHQSGEGIGGYKWSYLLHAV